MKNSSLILLLSKLDKDQLKEFSSFVKSPFFNSNKAIIKLYDYIKAQYPGYDPEKLEKKFAYKKVFGKTEYHENFMRVLMSKLQSLAEEYLIHKRVQDDTMAKKNYLLDQLRAIGERKLAEKIIKQELSSFDDFKPQKPEDYLQMYQFQYHKTSLFSEQFSITKGNIPGERIDNDQKYLISYFLLKILSEYVYYLSLSSNVNYKPKLIFLDEITAFLDKNREYLEIPMLNISYLSVIMLKNNNIDDFYKLKEALYISYGKILRHEIYNSISNILNYCQNSFFLTNDEKFLREKYELNMFALEKDILSSADDIKIGFARYYSILISFFEQDKLDDAGRFIEEYSTKLLKEDQDFWINFSYAALYSYKADFNTALSYLSKIRKLKNTMEKFNFKGLELKIYYDADLMEQAEMALDSFSHLIQKEGLLSIQYREVFKNFCFFYKKLLALKLKEDKSNSGVLREAIMSTPNVIQKKWLLKKIEELE